MRTTLTRAGSTVSRLSRKRERGFIAALAALLLATPAAAEIRADQAAFRTIYKALVETDTTLSKGSCTLAAQRMAVRLQNAGFGGDSVRLFEIPEKPREGGMVAVLPGSDPGAGAILLLSHLDVVEANRADWTRDPFTLFEEGGYFYGRGTSDDKAHGAIFVDTMLRLKAAGKPLRRTIKLALTCGEETGGAFNGAEWLVKTHKDWIAADFALNEGGQGAADAQGKPISLGMQAGEKVYQDFRIEATNPGGHSSRPRPDNAIYDLAEALVRIERHEFPVQLSDTTRAYFTARAAIDGGAAGKAMRALLANPADAEANAIVSKDPTLHSMLRTTCVATMLDGGHANNALPQRAGANINCRMFPGDPIENVRAQLARAAANPALTVVATGDISPTPPPPPLSPLVYGTAKAIGEKHFPGVPMLPTMAIGATDGRFLNAMGIPTYGVPGRFTDPDGNGVHGLNERRSVAGLYAERDYLFDLITAYAQSKDAE